MDFLSGLNPPQQEAVRHQDGPLLILAGAGSGKTRVITHRVAHLIAAHRVLPWSILAVTFTNKAANEMRDRVVKLVGSSAKGSSPWVSTFHSFCVRLLRRDGAPLAAIRPGFTTNFTIYDEDDQLAVLKALYRHHGLDEKFMQPRALQSRISSAKSHKESPADLYQSSKDPKASRVALLYEEYEGRLRQANAFDFDDLLLEAVRLLHHDEPVRNAYNNRFRYLLIDEYQDTNRSQYELMRLLTTLHNNICVVGDEDQSIYSWRGADIRNILDFERDYPDVRTIRLEQNYRSTKSILDAAGHVVANNKQRLGKWLWTDSSEGAPVGVYEAADGEREALFIADSIQRILAAEPSEHIAVLYRTNAQSRQIEEALRRYGRSYLVVGGFSFYQRAEVKDALAYLKAAISPADSISLLRIINTPARGIGRTTVEQIERFGQDHNLSLWSALERMIEEKLFPTRAEAAITVFKKLMEELRETAAKEPVHSALGLILDRTGYRKGLEADDSPESQSRLENLMELLNAAAEAAERGEGIPEFLDHAALVSESDQLDESAQILLLTVHNAKGLEFPTVFIAGMEERLFPHSRSIDSEPMIEEERRLCYVGMTRARKRLFLTWARQRRRYGGGSLEPCLPSRFLPEIPASLTEDLGERTRGREVDLFLDRHEVRETVRRTTYTGKTYNSLDHIQQFFANRNVPFPAKTGGTGKPPAPARAAVSPAPKPARQSRSSTIDHPRWGRGTIVRREGEGGDEKLTVLFPGHGLKKIYAKFAGLKEE